MLDNNFLLSPFKHSWSISFSSRHKKQFPQQSLLLPLKWTGRVPGPVINLISLSVIVTDVVPVSTPQSLHLLNHKATVTAVRSGWEERRLTEMVLQVQ